VVGEELGDDPETLARRFYRALKKDDDEELRLLLSERGLEGLRSGVGFRIVAETFDGWRVKRSRIEGAEAVVAVRTRIQDELQEIDLHFSWSAVREGWLIDGLLLFLPEAGELPIDFERLGRYVRSAEGPDGTVATKEEKALGGGEEERRQRVIDKERTRFEALVSTTEKKHDEHWTIQLVSRGRPARAVISEILEGTGVVVDERVSNAALDEPVRLELRGISRIEALERVAAQVGLVPVYPDLESLDEEVGDGAPRLRFEAGKRTASARFEGPFLIFVEYLEEHVPLATGTLTLGIYALGLLPSVLSFQDRLFEHVEITRLEGPGGSRLEAEQGVHYLGRPSIHGGLFGERVTIELAGLLRSVRRIVRLEGRVILRLPRYVQSYRWSEERREEPRSFGQRTLEILEWGETTRFRLRGPAESVSRTELRFSPLTKNRRALELLFDDSMAVGDELVAGMQTTESPLSLDVKVCTLQKLSYPFELSRMALPRHEEMPASLEGLSFEGELPVIVEFVGFQSSGEEVPEMSIRLINASNKDATRIVTEVVYLDAVGRAIGAFPHTWHRPGHDGEISSGSASRFVVARGMTLEQTRPALFMPRKTVRIRIDVKEIEFSDATRWPDPGPDR